MSIISVIFIPLALLMVAAVIYKRLRGRVGAAATGAVYDLLNEDRRRAVEMIVEETAEATDPETQDSQPSI